ncbi:MAG: VOC family protein [Phycisphaerae bacterium]|nr:VOC family protein [Phycisphaerae bacterium]
MSDEAPGSGAIVWHDLTVPDAAKVRDFYRDVIGWSSSGQDMGGYEDFNLFAANGECVAGVCHARGMNARVPPQWLMYVSVPDVAAAAERCAASGGRVIDGPRSMGGRLFCVIQDPAGAVLALIG